MADRKPVSTPWGSAVVVEEVAVAQDADGRSFTSLVQLLEGSEGEQLVRFVYTTGGIARRGPVTVRMQDLETLRNGLRDRQRLARALGWGGR